ncbi:MAG: hypothetical protein E6R03_09190 [Hyphomicrobiaceae bacterium]|nr:MAG: hypothetical protein E6R03_09190 [Hyphomicrobiaceae bacterium]
MGRLFTANGVSYGPTGLAPAGQLIYDVVFRLTKGYPFNMTVTRAWDGDRHRSSAHGRGEALDFRSLHLTPAQKASVLADIQGALYVSPRRFHAFLACPSARNEHLHVQVRDGLADLTPADLADLPN